MKVRPLLPGQIRSAVRAFDSCLRDGLFAVGAFLNVFLWWSGLFLGSVYLPDEYEYCQCHYEEVDNCVYEQTIVDGRRRCLLSRGQRCIGISIQSYKEVGKIHTAEEQSQRRHDDVFHQRSDYGSKATPITIPIAISRTLPFMANSLNSLINPISPPPTN